MCEGDCDVDTDCDGPDLQCFQRPGTETVSGCIGDGRSGSDYCALRPTPNTLFLKGNNGLPDGNFPLGLCEGGKTFDWIALTAVTFPLFDDNDMYSHPLFSLRL